MSLGSRRGLQVILSIFHIGRIGTTIILVIASTFIAQAEIWISDLPLVPGTQRVQVLHEEGRSSQAADSLQGLLREILQYRGKDAPELINLYLVQSKILYDLGNAWSDPKTQWSAEEALRIFELHYGPDDPRRFRPLQILGDILMDKGLLEDARSVIEKSLTVLDGVDPLSEHESANMLNKLGGICFRLGDYHKADDYFFRSFNIRNRLFKERGNYVAASLNNLGIIKMKLGDYDNALSLLHRSLDLRIEYYGDDHFEVGQTKNNLARVLLELGRLKQAHDYAIEAVENYEISLPAGHWDLADALSTLAEIEICNGNLAAASQFAQRVVDIRQTSLGGSHPYVADALYLLARVHVLAGNFEQAFPLAEKSEDVSLTHLKNMLRSLSERQALLYARDRVRGVDLMLACLEGSTSDSSIVKTWEAVIRQRTLVLSEVVARKRLKQLGPNQRQTFEDLAALRQQYVCHVLHGPGPLDIEVFESELNRIQESIDRKERKLAFSEAKQLSDLREEPPSLRIIQSRLETGTALIAYTTFLAPQIDGTLERRFTAFVLEDEHTIPIVCNLPSSELVDSLVLAWREAVENVRGGFGGLSRQETECRKIGKKLRQEIWDPIDQQLKHHDSVFIVPDGKLFLFSFAALPTEDTQYLQDSGPVIRYLNQEADLLSSLRDKDQGEGILILGGAEYGTVDMEPMNRHSISEADRHAGAPWSDCDAEFPLPPLPGSLREVRYIDKLWRDVVSGSCDVYPPPHLFTSNSATERAFRENAPSKRVLHVSVHGFFCGSIDPESGGIGNRAINPLVQSGLAFAGANHWRSTHTSDSDGLMTAEEISLLDLNSVHLVVLNGCNTGLGQIDASEGVLGLRWAFAAAGADRLVFSLWPVRDDIASEWMLGLYTNLLGPTTSYHESVWLTGGEILAKRRSSGLSTHPFYWAGFVAIE